MRRAKRSGRGGQQVRSESRRTVKIDKVAARPRRRTLNAEARTVTVTASDALSGARRDRSTVSTTTPTWRRWTVGTPVAAPDGLPHLFV